MPRDVIEQMTHTPGRTLRSEVDVRIAIAERQGWTNRSVPVLLLRAIAEQLAQRDDLLAACKLALEPANGYDEAERRRVIVRAAIAKAEGRG